MSSMADQQNWWFRALLCGAGLVFFSEALAWLGVVGAGIIGLPAAALAVLAIPGAYRFCRGLHG